MIKAFKFLILMLLLISSISLGAEDSDQPKVATTVTQARKADNKAKVVLTGMIVQRDNDYYLRDLTGQIKLDFPKKSKMQINTVSRVRINGRIKTNLLRIISKNVEPTVMVKSIEVVKVADTKSDTPKTD